MITEDYVSFETAKLLKEKGFDWECKRMFRAFKNSGPKVSDTQWITNGDLCDLYQNCEFATIPTLQMAMKWLRKVHNLEIYPFHDAIQENNDWWYRIEQHSKGYSLTEHESDIIYKSYEEACEAAIKYCLEKLI